MSIMYVIFYVEFLFKLNSGQILICSLLFTNIPIVHYTFHIQLAFITALFTFEVKLIKSPIH